MTEEEMDFRRYRLALNHKKYQEKYEDMIAEQERLAVLLKKKAGKKIPSPARRKIDLT
jgi:hypothetical protein